MTDKREEKGAFAWFLGKLVRTPAAYLGAIAGVGAGVASVGVDIPLAGAVGGGLMVSFAVGFISYAISRGIQMSYQASRRSEKGGGGLGLVVIDETLLTALRESGNGAIADLLGKIEEACRVVERHSRKNPADDDARHTAELAQALLAESLQHVAEYEDLARRVADPILDSPPGAEEALVRIRTDLEAAYRAVSDSRSRLRRGEQLSRTDFLEPVVSGTRLSALSAQLAEETAIARGVENRMIPGSKNIVFSENNEPISRDDDLDLEKE